MQVRLLGPLEVVDGTGQRVAVGGGKERTVLAVLAVHANEVVSLDRVADALWGDEPPRTAAKTVQAYVSRLRRAGITIDSSASGYTLRLAPEQLDVTRAEQAVVEGRAALGAGDPDRAATILRDAEDLWRGPALGELAGEPFALPEAARLNELRLVVLEERLAADLGRGEHAEVAVDLEAMCAEHPLRERLWGLRMLALYRSGRQAEALRAYQDVRELLAEELGIDPGPELQALERAVLAQAAELDAPARRVQQLPSGVVTFLLTDIEGSTTLWERDPDAMAGALARHDAMVADAVFRGGGVLIKSKGEGDATLSVFARASEAAGAAVELCTALAAEHWPGALALRVRMALHTGEAYERDGDYYGPAVNRAARLRGLAAGGQILVSQAAAELLADHLPAGSALRALGVRQLRGLTRDEHVFALEVGEGADAAQPRPADEAPVLTLPPALATRSEVFVGRQRAVERLQRAWRSAAAGNRRAVLLAGEPGIGKSRLAAELAATVHPDRGLVLYGRCAEDVAAPYQPFVDAVRPFVAACPAALLREQLGRSGSELARVIPELTEKLPDLPVPTRTDADSERYLLFSAWAALLGRLSSLAPALLVLDDLQWAARPTLLLLRHLLRAEIPMSLLVVATYRDTELDGTEGLAEVVADLRQDWAVDAIQLGGLDRDGVAAFVDRAAEGKADERSGELVAALHEGTRGNPLFIREVIAHLAESGLVYQRDDGTWTSDVRTVDELSIPARVRDVINQRVARLSPAAARALAVAAVVGPTFSLPLLERVPDARDDPDQVLDALEEAMDAGILVEESGTVFAFSHALVRHTLLDGLSAARRVRLHGRIGEAIESLPATDEHLPALAYHFAEASVDGRSGVKAARYALDAARQALGRLAVEAAISHVDRALDVIETAGATDPEVTAELLVTRTEALNITADTTTIKLTALEAMAAAKAAGRADLLGRALLLYGQWVVVGTPDPLARPMFDEALERTGDDPPLHARVMAGLANYVLNGEGHAVEAAEIAGRALALARAHGDPLAVERAASIRGLTLIGSADVEERLALGEELMALADRTDAPDARLDSLILRSATHLEIADLSALEHDVEAFEALADRLHWWAARFFSLQFRGTLACMHGRFEEARRASDEMVETGAHDTNAVNAYAAQVFTLAREQGTLADLLPLVEDTVERNPQLVAFRAALAAAHAELGHRDEAAAHVDGLAAGDFAAVQPGQTWAISLALVAEACAHTGNAAAAEGALERLLPRSGRLVFGAGGIACIGPVDRYLGLAAGSCGRWGQAEEHLGRALELELRLGLPPMEARTRLWYARALSHGNRPGDGDRSRDHAARALAIARELGMAGVAAAAEPLSRQPPP